ncbi:hypothetical protein WR25_07275 isoform C [Diploscapter pachys]|uniref:C2H2-type domain-containing protein n=1 Tax=Diploscapter pachys TaxID=2018661 RepID=A0A2A2KXW4_9BILA|nr:hypothetical protein WR25_07275 isoform A [Diploscapter pachys]PAV78778.1 hypothetical protein WR25_07275 isoform B [Diploscapter pachys]PAV78779.1 hypothetical protein WR25_07275 isoform C [Diploscapter pachys]
MGLNCPVCSYRKPDRKSLKEHICFEHLELDRYKCMLCSRTRVTKKQILEHCLAIHGQLNSPMMFNYIPEKEEKLKELMELAKSVENQSEQRAEEERKGQQLNVASHTLDDVFNKNSHIDNKDLETKAGIFMKRPAGIGMRTAKWQTKMSYKMALERLKMKMDAEQNGEQEQRLKRTIKMENDWMDSEADAADALLRLRFSNIHSDTPLRFHARSRDGGVASSSSGAPFSSSYHFQRLPALLPIKRGRSKGEMLLPHTKGLKQKLKIPVGSNEKIGKKGRKAFDRYKCKKCGEVVNSNHLGHHAAYHLDNPIYSCSADDCRFTHFLKTGINLHIKQAHDGQAQVEGEVTEDVKEQIKRLQMECFAGVTPQSLVLSKKRPALNLVDRVRCKICDKNISNRADNLRGHCASHMLSIHQQPRFTCRLCGHSAAFYTTIRDHCITSHGNESHKEFDDAIKSWKAEHVRDVSLKCFGDENFLLGKMPQGWKPADPDAVQIANVAVDVPHTIAKV